MVFELPNHHLVVLLRDWISLVEFYALNSALCNKNLRESVLSLIEISVQPSPLSSNLRTKLNCTVKICSDFLNTTSTKTLVFCEKVSAKLQFDIFEDFFNNSKLNEVTCVSKTASITQLLVNARCDDNVTESKKRFIMWDIIPNKNDHIVFKDGSNYTSKNDSTNVTVMSGQVVIFSEYNGESYFGEFLYGRRHGFGKLIRNTTGKKIYMNSYEGNFIRSEYNGHGTAVFGNGDVYCGEWIANQMHGSGVMKYANGEIRNGEWFENKLRGGEEEDVTKKMLTKKKNKNRHGY
jgi:hypothetical protein